MESHGTSSTVSAFLPSSFVFEVQPRCVWGSNLFAVLTVECAIVGTLYFSPHLTADGRVDCSSLGPFWIVLLCIVFYVTWCPSICLIVECLSKNGVARSQMGVSSFLVSDSTDNFRNSQTKFHDHPQWEFQPVRTLISIDIDGLFNFSHSGEDILTRLNLHSSDC